MKLKILLPMEILLDREVDKVVAEAANGEFCILPRHIDYVTALVPGLMSFTADGTETFLAVDGGVMVKRGDEVFVSSPRAVIAPDLGELERTVKEKFLKIDENEKKARTALSKLEADIVRSFIEME